MGRVCYDLLFFSLSVISTGVSTGVTCNDEGEETKTSSSVALHLSCQLDYICEYKFISVMPPVYDICKWNVKDGHKAIAHYLPVAKCAWLKITLDKFL